MELQFARGFWSNSPGEFHLEESTNSKQTEQTSSRSKSSLDPIELRASG